ncbi:RWD domain-containing protein 2B-like [Asterias rubens]|uniref:RWD domain-containing protein 2B-like n=1 Tax=Asterias rubens TaxID=7604 RepID=UPI0014555A55|nr:RWD domain-containing protein 2B-like [Asterias rubens]
MNSKEVIELQISEVDMLQSMFPDEFCVDDPSAISEARSIVDGEDSEHNCGVVSLPQITFTIKIKIDTPECNVQVICELPQTYPKDTPEVLVRSDAPPFSRQEQKRLNDDLAEHILSLDRGELVIGEAVQWIQDNFCKYVATVSPSSCEDNNLPHTTTPKRTKEEDTFTRLWIHSHHIYSKIKRRLILDWGSEFPVTGFCLPGKPGIICIEGEKCYAEEFWSLLRKMTWKKISCKHREDFPLRDEKGQLKVLKLFNGFDEKAFSVRGGRDYHMDLGLFFQFLEQHECGSVFKILLGVDGKVSSKTN